MTSQPGRGVTAGAARVAISGAASPLGRRVAALVAAAPDAGPTVVLDVGGTGSAGDLAARLDGVAVLLHLVEPGLGSPRGRRRRVGAVDATRRALAAAAEAGVGHVVVLSSALAYGARPDNPVPLTEEAPLRPNRGVAAALEAAEVESLVAGWRAAHPDATATVLRPTVVVARGANGFLARALRRSAALPAGAVEPPAQFVDLDDLAAAVDLARRDGLDGVFNVAPDGWVEGETLRALAGGPRLRLPSWAATAVVRTGWRWGVGATPPELLPYLRHPWVVANDRLRAAGWVPEHSSEEAYVAAHRAGPAASLSPQRRQALALGAATTALAATAAALVTLLRRRR